MTHHCHARGCDAAVPPKMFMCSRHWFMLPKPMRDAIWATYRPGQEVTKDPSSSYLKNAATAVEWLAARQAEQLATIGQTVSMPAITLWQPWASLVAVGAKRFEFRSWPAPARYHGARIAIHAGARPVRKIEVQDLLYRLQIDDASELALDPARAEPLLSSALHSSPPLSAIVCTAILGKPVRNADLAEQLGTDLDQAVNDSDRAEHTNWGWPLSDIRPIDPPISLRGAQGFWMARVPPEHARG